MTGGDVPKPLLSDRDTARYARQIIVPDVGAKGQARLRASTAAILGEGPGALAARDYLAAAGLTIARPPYSRPVDCVVVTDCDLASTPLALPLATPDAPFAWYALDGTALTGGVTTSSGFGATALRPRARRRGDAAAVALHRVGGADAAASAIAALLEWTRPPEAHEIRLSDEEGKTDQAVGGEGTTSERS